MTTIETHVAEHIAYRQRISARDLANAACDRFSAILIKLLDWQYSARERRQLLGLSDRALQDFGASRADAEGECGKRFWQ